MILIYFVFIDFGFVQFVIVDMIMKNVCGEWEDVFVIFQSVFLLFVGLFVVIFVLFSFLLVLGIFIDRLKDYWIIQNVDVVVLLVGYVVGCLLFQVIFVGFCFIGNYVVGMLFFDIMGFFEGFVVFFVVYCGVGF